MIINTLNIRRKTMRACDECGRMHWWFVEIGFKRSPMRASLCRECAKKFIGDMHNHLYGRASGKQAK